VKLVGNIPIVIVNEPMLISNGKNSDIRYNFFYPRWAYDQYRALMTGQSLNHRWTYVDLWDAVPANQFTNSAIHLTSLGETQLAKKITPIITAVCK